MKYALWNTEDKRYRRYNGGVRLFTSNAEIEEYAKTWKMNLGRYEIREWDEAPWREDIRKNLAEGIAISPLWADEGWYQDRVESLGHYPSVNRKDKMLLDFYPDIAKAEKGQSQSVKPGKYLKTFYGDVLTEKDIKNWTDAHREQFASAPKVKWATTPEEIEEVYSMDAGFNSCMQHTRSHWSHYQHPTKAYGAGDLAVAYINNGNTLLARAIVWKDKKKVGRVYGDVSLLRNALRDEDIHTDSDNSRYDSLEGARMLYLPLDPMFKREGFVDVPALLPYIDNNGNVTGLSPDPEDENKLIIVPSTGAKFNAIDQNGVIQATHKCSCCGQKYGARSEVVAKPGYTYSGGVYRSMFTERYCPDCRDEHTFVDANTSSTFSSKTYTKVPFWYYSHSREPQASSQYLALEAMQDSADYFISDESKQAFRSAEKWASPDGKTISRGERDRLYRLSHYDGKYYLKDTVRVHNDKFYNPEQYTALIASAHDLFLRTAGRVDNATLARTLASLTGDTNSTGTLDAA